MYIPKNFLATDRQEITAFMQQYSFATLVTAQQDYPVATHLPFLVSVSEDKIMLASHLAKANEQWKGLADRPVLVIFSEPHAYISPRHYDKELNVPTWNYISVHAYGRTRLVDDTAKVFDLLEATIEYYEAEYKQQWQRLPDDYKLKMSKGIVAFEIEVTDLQAKKKLSQNKTEAEQERIIRSLSASDHTHERDIAGYMKKNLAKDEQRRSES